MAESAGTRCCPSCGEDNPERARFCLVCGTALTEPTVADRRRVVTVLFSDLVGSTALAEQLDPENLREVLEEYFDLMRDAIQHHGGVVEKYIGDAVMAVFGLTRAHEDDALRACRAALDMGSALERLDERLRSEGLTLAHRTGIFTGEVVAGDPAGGQRLVTGDAVNTAARLEQAAAPGTILIGRTTYDLTKHALAARPAAPVHAKGKAAPVQAYVLQGPSADPRHDAPRPLMGRAAEQEALAGAWAQVASDRSALLATVVGEPGMGKSRLLDDCVQVVSSNATVMRGRCLPYGEAVALAPLGRALRDLTEGGAEEAGDALVAELEARVAADSVARRSVRPLAEGAGLVSGETSLDRTVAAATAVLSAVASRRPLLLVVDDLHWAEDALLDTMRRLTDDLAGWPVLLVGAGRPADHWESRLGPPDTRVALRRLDRSALGSLASVLLDGAVSERLVTELTEAADGNPLYAEQLLTHWAERDLLVPAPGGWVPAAAQGDTPVPPTIAALLAARIDDLPTRERILLERAAVACSGSPLGCPEPLLEGLMLSEDQPLVDDDLQHLWTARFLVPEEGSGVRAWRFVHVLVREAAYGALLRRDRSAVHERCAAWFDDAAPGDEQVEGVVAFHLERAYLDAAGRTAAGTRLTDLGDRAWRRLAQVATSAMTRGELEAAASWADRALAIAPHDHPERTDLLIQLGTALRESGGRDRAAAVLKEAEELAAGARDVSRTWSARRQQLEMVDDADQLEAESRAFLPALEERDDRLGLARAWRMISLATWWRGRLGEAETHARRALAFAEAAGDVRECMDIRAGLPAMMLAGPSPVSEALAEAEATLDAVRGSLRSRGYVEMVSAWLWAMADQHDRALDAWERAGATWREGGVRRWSWLATSIRLQLDVLAGRADRALGRAVDALEGPDDLGPARGPFAAEVVLLMCEAGRADQARALEEAVLSTNPDAPEDQCVALCARAFLTTAGAGRPVTEGHPAVTRARQLVDDAFQVLEGTDLVDSRAWVHFRRAKLEDRLGRRTVALGAADEAAALFRAKGNAAAAALVDDFAARLDARHDGRLDPP